MRTTLARLFFAVMIHCAGLAGTPADGQGPRFAGHQFSSGGKEARNGIAESIPQRSDDSRPNVIVILVDDMGWSDIGCYGSEIPTPNLDALAAGGVRFTQFYNTGRCSPTRASLLTGHYPHQAGMGHLDDKQFPDHPGFQGKLADTSVTIAEVLRDAGYATLMSGKWHLGHHHGCDPWNRGFGHSLSFPKGGIYFPAQGNGPPRNRIFIDGREHLLDDPVFGQDWYGTTLTVDWGLKFVDQAIEEDRPFFLYLPFCAPHFPLMAPEEVIAGYRGKFLDGWDRLRDARWKRQIEMGLVDPRWQLTERAPNTPAWDKVSPQDQKRCDDQMAIYAAMIDQVDDSVGRLVRGLQQRGELENTLLFFMSDNGGNAEGGPDGKYTGDHPGDAHSNVFVGQNWATLNNTPFRKWKHHTHEGGIATPLIVSWPGKIRQQPGSVVHQPGHLIDILPTIVAATGATMPNRRHDHTLFPPEGIDLMPAIAGRPLERNSPIFFNHEDNRAVRDGQWKLVAAAGKSWELYDMQADRTETHDLSGQQPERVAAMAKRYREWAVRTLVVCETSDRKWDSPEPGR